MPNKICTRESKVNEKSPNKKSDEEENKPIPFIKPPLPTGIDLREVNWQVLSVNTNAWFALNTENYLSLSKNMVDIAEYIQKLRVVTQQYSTNHSKMFPNKTND